MNSWNEFSERLLVDFQADVSKSTEPDHFVVSPSGPEREVDTPQFGEYTPRGQE